MIRHCEISIYHFRVAVELAFLTTVTHLLTLVALDKYFIKNRWTNLPRVIIMMSNLAMLGYTSFVAYSYDKAGLHLSYSLACYYKGKRPDLKAVFGGKWAALLCGALGGHCSVILGMYFHSERLNKKSRFLKNGVAGFRTWVLAPAYAIYGFYMVGTELRQTNALDQAPVAFEDPKEEREWGIGQLLSLLLLALPIFAGWESFWGESFLSHYHHTLSTVVLALTC
jgi:amino acid transporter